MKKRSRRFFLNLFAFLALFIGMQQLIELKTRGFCLQKIICDDLPFQSKWESPNQECVDTLLSQPYTFLGAGSECFAFLSADETTVIKFFKLDIARPVYLHRGIFKEDHSAFAGTLSNHPLTRHFFPWIRRWMGMREFRIHRTFTSIKLAYDALKEETGLLYLHLNPTTHLQKTLVIYDPCGIAHEVDLDATRFFLQKKAVPLEKRLSELKSAGEHIKARACIDSLLQMIVSRCKKGFADRDVLNRNLGVIGTQAIEIDSGSFIPDPKMSTPLSCRQEIYFATLELKWWIEKHYPEMTEYLLQEITACIEKNGSSD